MKTSEEIKEFPFRLSFDSKEYIKTISTPFLFIRDCTRGKTLVLIHTFVSAQGKRTFTNTPFTSDFFYQFFGKYQNLCVNRPLGYLSCDIYIVFSISRIS